MTTNYEISKKLAEMGFVGESETWKHDPNNFILGQKYWSYDFETIWDALPENFKDYQDDECNLKLSKNAIWYENEFGNLAWLCSYEVVKIKKEQSESLADTAARLLILLAQQKIINFK